MDDIKQVQVTVLIKGLTNLTFNSARVRPLIVVQRSNNMEQIKKQANGTFFPKSHALNEVNHFFELYTK